MPASLPPLPPSSPTTFSPAQQRLLHALTTCTSTASLCQIQSQILHSNLLNNTTIFSSFILCCHRLNHLRPALHLFSLLRRPHVFVCNTLLKCVNSPLPLFSHMLKSSISPNRYTLPIVLKSVSLPLHGRLIHAMAVKLGFGSDFYVQNSLLHVYCSDMADAERLFNEMPVRNVVTWTTLVDGYKNSGRFFDSIAAFNSMQLAGFSPNRVTMIAALGSCASISAIDTGQWIHEYIARNGWDLDVKLGTSLVDMYCKCGQLEAAINVFFSMKQKNAYTYNSLIGGLAMANRGLEALSFFSQMEKEGIQADSVTLINVLTAFSHAGLVETGKQIFDSILKGKYKFEPKIKHYGCMLDLLGQAGLLKEAFKLVEEMPMGSNVVVWGLLFGVCRKRGHRMWSEVVVRRMIELEPNNVAHHVLLANLYAETGRWREAHEVRWRLKERGLRKEKGLSFVESELCDRRF
ncbi:hypothetical protein LUZ60_003737 [Juncus effusus]|nr:hypothetical protein LUZ60_003737 [Juncus effusus]